MSLSHGKGYYICLFSEMREEWGFPHFYVRTLDALHGPLILKVMVLSQSFWRTKFKKTSESEE